jgi:hypothetical protein
MSSVRTYLSIVNVAEKWYAVKADIFYICRTDLTFRQYPCRLFRNFPVVFFSEEKHLSLSSARICLSILKAAEKRCAVKSHIFHMCRTHSVFPAYSAEISIE